MTLYLSQNCFGCFRRRFTIQADRTESDRFQTSKAKQALLFVNKKKQKNFVLRAVATAWPTPTVNRSFLVLFFKKEPRASVSSGLRRTDRVDDAGKIDAGMAAGDVFLVNLRGVAAQFRAGPAGFGRLLRQKQIF